MAKKIYTDEEAMEELKSFGGEIKELQTGCEKPCYLASKSETEHLLYVPSNVIRLNSIGEDWDSMEFTSQIQDLKGSLKVIGGSGLQSCARMFEGCTNLESVDISNFDTREVKDMFGMLNGCDGLNSLIIGNMNTVTESCLYGMPDKCNVVIDFDLAKSEEPFKLPDNIFAPFYKTENIDLEKLVDLRDMSTKFLDDEEGELNFDLPLPTDNEKDIDIGPSLDD